MRTLSFFGPKVLYHTDACRQQINNEAQWSKLAEGTCKTADLISAASAGHSHLFLQQPAPPSSDTPPLQDIYSSCSLTWRAQKPHGEGAQRSKIVHVKTSTSFNFNPMRAKHSNILYEQGFFPCDTRLLSPPSPNAQQVKTAPRKPTNRHD